MLHYRCDLLCRPSNCKHLLYGVRVLLTFLNILFFFPFCFLVLHTETGYDVHKDN